MKSTEDSAIEALDVLTWVKPSHREFASYLDMLKCRDHELKESGKSSIRGCARELSSKFTPVEIYCYLKTRFGEANGICMMLAEPSSDNLYHWHYLVKAGGTFAEIQSTQTGLSILLHSNCEVTETDWLSFEEHLRREIGSHEQASNEKKRQLEDWTVIVNPYCRFNEVIATLELRSSGLSLKIPHLPSSSLESYGVSPEERERFLSEADTYRQTLVEAQLVGMAIRTSVPIWIESFINLLLFTLAKPRIKKDQRLFDSVTRQHIDVRVKLLSEHCDGFERAVKDTDKPFLDMQKLFGRRNSVLHGAIDVKELTTDRMYFDGKIPVYREWMPDFLRRVPRTLAFIEPDAAASDILVGSNFMIYLANLLKPSVREQLWLIADNPLLGYRKDKKQLGVLFSKAVIFPMLGPSRSLSNAEPTEE